MKNKNPAAVALGKMRTKGKEHEVAANARKGIKKKFKAQIEINGVKLYIKEIVSYIGNGRMRIICDSGLMAEVGMNEVTLI